jgi:hypothetical protein
MYSDIYGRNRDERASKMYLKVAPKGYTKPQPERKRFSALDMVAHFRYGEYVEDLTKLTDDRTYIVVRSQKTTRQYKKYYFIKVDLKQMSGRNKFMGTCTCKDTHTMCKHKIALLYTVRGNMYNLRFL